MANDFTKRPIEQFAKLNVLCGCGMHHEVTTKKLDFSGDIEEKLPDAIAQLLPTGNVLLVTEEDLYIPYARRAEKAIRNDYLVTVHLFQSGFTPDVKDCGRLLNYGDGVGMVIAYGGGGVCDVAKYYASLYALPLVTVCCSPHAGDVLSPYALLHAGDGMKRMRAKAPDLFFLDTHAIEKAPQRLVAAGYGRVASMAVAVFDASFRLALRGGYYCQSIVNLCNHAISLALAEGEGLIAGNSESRLALCKSLAYLGLIEQMIAPHHLSGGEQGVAELLKKQCRLYGGEAAFQAAMRLIPLYKHYFEQEITALLPPPDYARRAELLEQLMGVSQKEYLVEVIRREPVNEGVEAHVINEYRKDFLSSLTALEANILRATTVFRRIYPDRGKLAAEAVSAGALRLAVGLGAELSEQYTMLTYLRDAGLLDELLSEEQV